MSLNHIIEGGSRDVDLDVKSLKINGAPVGGGVNLDQADYPGNFTVNGGTYASGDVRYQRIGNYITLYGEVVFTSGIAQPYVEINCDLPSTLPLLIAPNTLAGTAEAVELPDYK
jgi:hypothetical protein